MRRLLFILFAAITLVQTHNLRASDVADKALFTAIKAGDASAFAAALASGANVNAVSEDGTPALVAAVLANSYDLVAILISENADINLTDGNGEPAINWATHAGHLQLVELFLRNKASTQLGQLGGTRQIAMRHGHRKILLMLSRHDRIPVPNPDAAMLADAIAGGDIDGVLEALMIGVSANSLDFTGRPVLTLAAIRGNPAIIDILLNKGASINAVDEIGFTALMEAARAHNPGAVKTLLIAGANAALKAKDGTTAVDLYLQSGGGDLKALLQH